MNKDKCEHGFTRTERHLCIECQNAPPPLGGNIFDRMVEGDLEWNMPDFRSWKEGTDDSTAGLYDCQHDDDIRTCLICAERDGHILAQSAPPKTTVILGAGGLVTTLWSGGQVVGAWHTITGRPMSLHAAHTYTIDRAVELGIAS